VEGSAKVYESVNSMTGNTGERTTSSLYHLRPSMPPSVYRWFCEGCGSHLHGYSSGHPEYTNVKAGNIEEFTKLPVIAEGECSIRVSVASRDQTDMMDSFHERQMAIDPTHSRGVAV
jgi:hypothetical protein